MNLILFLKALTTLKAFFLQVSNLWGNATLEQRQRTKTKATYRRISNIYHRFLKFYENKFTPCLKKQHHPLDNGAYNYLAILEVKQVYEKALVLYCYFITILLFSRNYKVLAYRYE